MSSTTQSTNLAIQTRLFWSLLLIGFLQFGTVIPVPGIDYTILREVLSNTGNNNLLSNSTTSQFIPTGYFALSIYPYINASIILQVLIALVPSLKKLQREEGEFGKQKINQYIRYLTVIFAFIQSLGLTFLLKPYVLEWTTFWGINLISSLTAGSLIVLWVSEIISRFGITNGSTLVIFFNILSQLPSVFESIRTNLATDLSKSSLLILVFVFVMVCVIFIQETIRLIPLLLIRQKVQKASLPFRLNQAGVMPIVCSSALMPLLVNFANFLNSRFIMLANISVNNTTFNQFIYCIVDFVLILTFTYFYSTLFLDPKDISNELRKMTASIPNVQPGIPTTIYLERILRRVSFLGGLLLATSVLVVNILDIFIQIPNLRGLGVSSQLIIVGVILDVLRQSELSLISDRLEKSEENL